MKVKERTVLFREELESIILNKGLYLEEGYDFTWHTKGITDRKYQVSKKEVVFDESRKTI